MAYTDQAHVEALLGASIPSSLSPSILADWIAGVKLWIDSYCQKTFEGVSEARYYDGNGKNSLLIDEFTSDPTEVLILNFNGTTQFTLTVGNANDYVTAPYNLTEKNVIQLSRVGRILRFPKRPRCVKVTALFGGSASVPKDVQIAATKLIAQLYKERGKPGDGDITRIRLGDYEAMFSPIDTAARELGITNILDGYRNIDL